MGETLVKRTKVLYLAIGLMLFGGAGVCLQATQSTNTVGVVAPALTDACKNYNFYNTHTDACGAAAGVTSSPTAPAPVPAATNPAVEANRSPLISTLYP